MNDMLGNFKRFESKSGMGEIFINLKETVNVDFDWHTTEQTAIFSVSNGKPHIKKKMETNKMRSNRTIIFIPLIFIVLILLPASAITKTCIDMVCGGKLPCGVCNNAIMGDPKLRKQSGWRNMGLGELTPADFDVMEGGAGIDKAERIVSDKMPDYKNLSTMIFVNGIPTKLKCPDWDWSLIPKECRNIKMISSNCLPMCGKYPGDEPDIGPREYYAGITPSKPWGAWNGVPEIGKPILIKSPKNFRLK